MLVTVLYYALIIKVMHLNALNCIMATDVDTIHLLKNPYFMLSEFILIFWSNVVFVITASHVSSVTVSGCREMFQTYKIKKYVSLLL